jgi:hypothetical protein
MLYVHTFRYEYIAQEYVHTCYMYIHFGMNTSPRNMYIYIYMFYVHTFRYEYIAQEYVYTCYMYIHSYGMNKCPGYSYRMNTSPRNMCIYILHVYTFPIYCQRHSYGESMTIQSALSDMYHISATVYTHIWYRHM